MNTDINWQIEFHDSLPSTNDYCIKQAELNSHINLAISAKKQTKAKGSRGRQWYEPNGNLALSFLFWPPNFNGHKYCWIPFVASLALYDTILPLCKKNLVIKWPNDLLYNQKKLAGILIENSIDYPGIIRWVVIGLGVNIYEAPILKDKETTCIKDFTSEPPSIIELTKTIKNHLSKWLQFLIEGYEPLIRSTWLKYSIPIGTFINVKTNVENLKGIYQGIDDRGNLLLKTQADLKKLSVAQIF